MNVDLITMDPAEARERLRATRKRLHRRADDEYRALEAGYQALAEGTPLINLAEVIRAGGFDAQMRPRLAVARADRRQVAFTWDPRETRGHFDASSARTPLRQLSESSLLVEVELERRHGVTTPGGWEQQVTGFALVPIIPPHVREASGVAASRDREHFILWEVEQWADSRIRSTPDVDPFLLRHLGGDLYAVLAEWDLTPLERAVMAGRRTAN